MPKERYKSYNAKGYSVTNLVTQIERQEGSLSKIGRFESDQEIFPGHFQIFQFCLSWEKKIFLNGKNA